MNFRDSHNIDDLRWIAQQRLSRAAQEFLERGAEDDVMPAENHALFAAVERVGKETGGAKWFQREVR